MDYMREEFERKRQDMRLDYEKKSKRARRQFIVFLIGAIAIGTIVGYRFMPYVSELYDSVITFLNK